MAPATALVAVAVASMVRGGARKTLPPPPPPQQGLNLKGPYEAFMKMNEPMRFFISGNCGNVVFFYLERLTFLTLQKTENLPVVMQEYMDSVSFFIAYILQVVPQHWLHAFLVYGLHSIDTRKKYFTTLLGCYSCYTGSLFGSTLLNTFFVKILKLNKGIAFITTLWTFAAINYFIMGWIVRQAEGPAPKVVLDARKAAKDAQRAIQESKRKEQAKAKIVDAKMKAKAEQAKLKAKALEERMKAKADLEKIKAKELAQQEKERSRAKAERLKQVEAKLKAEKLKEDPRKKVTYTQIKEVGNKAAQNSATKTIVKARGGGGGGGGIQFWASLDSKELLHAFVLSIGDAVHVE